MLTFLVVNKIPRQEIKFWVVDLERDGFRQIIPVPDTSYEYPSLDQKLFQDQWPLQE